MPRDIRKPIMDKNPTGRRGNITGLRKRGRNIWTVPLRAGGRSEMQCGG